MSIRFKCTCGKALKAKEEHKGKRTKCPFCGAVLQIPSQAGDVLKQLQPQVTKLYRCVKCEGEFSAGEVLDDNGEIICKRCFNEDSSKSADTKKVILLLSFGVVLTIGICLAVYFFFIIGPPFRPTGFSVTADRLDSGSIPGFSEEYYETVGSNKSFLIVYGSIRSGCLIPVESDDKYQEIIKWKKEKGKSLTPRDCTHFYNPANFRLILRDKQTHQGKLITRFEKGSQTRKRFSSLIVIYSPSPFTKNEREEIAVVWVLDSVDCAPPFKIAFRDKRPVRIPNKQLPFLE
jgi:DNA-directed RNA polymerase subunit RPC12/RpoP